MKGTMHYTGTLKKVDILFNQTTEEFAIQELENRNIFNTHQYPTAIITLCKSFGNPFYYNAITDTLYHLTIKNLYIEDIHKVELIDETLTYELKFNCEDGHFNDHLLKALNNI